MSWPAVRTEPIAPNRASVGLLAKAVVSASLAATVSFAFIAALGAFAVAVGSKAREAWSGEEFVTVSEFFSPVGVFFGTFFFWVPVLAIVSVVIVPLAWLVALPLAVVAARAGCAGWLSAMMAGAALGGATAAGLEAWPNGVLKWDAMDSLFAALGLLYGRAFWLAVRQSAPGLLRSRLPRAAP